ncbi:MAG TPA: histidine kinase dimerization/phosphoacceptor domain -containing protein [Xanthobacteraceae bacterium]|jgi:two-component sensor histidine kinase|nr:histidine kinase dimerization/phosphoacceptor domain -containing protein [Xanthobacteraceae bacterium]
MTSERPRILYIDDDPELAHLMRRSLGRRGYDVENVASSEAGLKRLAAGGIDVIALDHFLPTGTGLDFLVSLRDFVAPPPVVYVTAAAEPTVAVAALKSGATDYVLKTVGEEFFELLGTAIDQALEKARLQRDRDRAEREVREGRDRAEALLHEVNHRVANSLALVASMVALQARAVSEPSVRTALNEIQGRISAIAGVHRRLYTSQDVRSVEISEYLASLLRDLEATLKEAGHASTVRLDTVQTEVPTDKAVSIGVLVTELVTNAFKYAYPDAKAGEIRVGLHNSAVGKIRLSVEDDGVGWRGEGPIQGTGVGSRIIQAMARGLGAPVTYSEAPGGCHISLEFDV